ncbi:MAG TPA: AAA family ATPase, partial [Solirubrobacteraceae bacterium]|nr:AAA family ATPase [Solirubrobacteraceae bacterium]
MRTGRSPVLVLRGEAGVGKSALLEYLVDQASGCRVVRATGAEAEMELAYAGLQQLCAPLLDHLDALPAPQREALSTAFGLSAGHPPDRFFVGLAVLSLCAEAARERPLLCVVDDAQWLDRASAQALAFVARRLDAESVALVLGIREVGDESELPGLPDMTVRGLTDDDARALLESAVHVQLDERVRNRIVAETRGNPLALLELPRAMTPAELAGGYAVPEAMPMASRIEQGFRRRLESLPPDTRRLLLTAAAEPVGDATVVWRAAERLGIGVEAAAAASAAGLLEINGRVRFRHPLVRSAAYRASPRPDRQEVHRALADVTDPERDPDRRAWHRANATDGPDEEVAAELERSADRAAARGGIAAAAAFLQRAAELTPDPAARGGRALAAAQAKFESASPEAALELLALAELCPLEELQRARLERLRAEVVFARTRGRDAPALLLDAARKLEPLDAAMARETHLEAVLAAMFAGRLGDGPSVREAAEAARAGPPASEPPRAIDLLLDGLTARFTEGYAAAVPALREALATYRGVDGSTARDQRWFWLACRLA